MIAGVFAAVCSCGAGCSTTDASEEACGFEELQVLQQECLEYKGSFEGAGAAEELLDCGGDVSAAELLRFGGYCKLQGSGTCSTSCKVDGDRLVGELSGSWQLELTDGVSNTMDLDPSLRGRAKVHIWPEGSYVVIDYDVEVVVGLGEYVLYFDARRAEDQTWNFVADCEEANGWLRCQGRAQWSDHPVDWQRTD